jgi:hypothetical protein
MQNGMIPIRRKHDIAVLSQVILLEYFRLPSDNKLLIFLKIRKHVFTFLRNHKNLANFLNYPRASNLNIHIILILSFLEESLPGD